MIKKVILDYHKDNFIIRIPEELIELSDKIKKYSSDETKKMDKEIEILKRKIKKLEGRK